MFTFDVQESTVLQVFAIEFVTFAIDFIPFAIEFIIFAMEFGPFTGVCN